MCLCARACLSLFLYTYIYIYIYMLWCYYLGQVWPFEVLLSGPSLFFYKTLFVKKHYKNRGFSTFVLKKNCARKFEVLLSGPSWSFLRCSQLGPDNNTYLAQIITPQNAFFFKFFCFYKCAEIPIFIVFLNMNQNLAKRGKKKR